jgi:hypothetical protein
MKTWVSVGRTEPAVTVLRASVGWTCGSMNWKSDQVLFTPDAGTNRVSGASKRAKSWWDDTARP